MTLDQDKFRGALLGLAAGDALGTTVEFSPRGSFAPLTNIVGGGPFNLNAGEWTDDTSMALCLGQSLVNCQGMDPVDQLNLYCQWWRNGLNSVKGHCFDIGNTVRSALIRYENTSAPDCGSTAPMSAGNGSIMRLAPVPLFFAQDPTKADEAAAVSSRTTHAATEAVDGCRLLTHFIISALRGRNKAEILSVSSYSHGNLCPRINMLAQGSYQEKAASDIRGSGYVVESLEAALWAFWNSNSFEEGALLAVNLGDDADTTGAVYGQIAGAYYGIKGIPQHWLKKLAWKDRITTLADDLFAAAHA
ncbi:MAG: ADP-ribosylglycohydrolase family protein [Verrucomicrobiales bacterium]|nr:ADP-ribosylglycohydrolase family protein [Verrucomicrobiales bacterium]